MMDHEWKSCPLTFAEPCPEIFFWVCHWYEDVEIYFRIIYRPVLNSIWRVEGTTIELPMNIAFANQCKPCFQSSIRIHIQRQIILLVEQMQINIQIMTSPYTSNTVLVARMQEVNTAFWKKEIKEEMWKKLQKGNEIVQLRMTVFSLGSVCVCTCMCVWVCLCVCVCACEWVWVCSKHACGCVSSILCGG